MRGRPSTVAPGQTVSTQDPALRRRQGEGLARPLSRRRDPEAHHAIDWGWFHWFMRPIFDLLVFLFHAIGNFGLAIIA